MARNAETPTILVNGRLKPVPQEMLVPENETSQRAANARKFAEELKASGASPAIQGLRLVAAVPHSDGGRRVLGLI